MHFFPIFATYSNYYESYYDFVFLISIPIALILIWLLALFILHIFTDNPSTTAVTITSIILIVFNIVAYIKVNFKM